MYSTEKQSGAETSSEIIPVVNGKGFVSNGIQDENVEAMLENPLGDRTPEQLMADAEAFARKHGLEDHIDVFRKGALIAQDRSNFEHSKIFTEEDKAALRREVTHKWSQPRSLYALVTLCSVAAAVQGVCDLLFPPIYDRI